MQFRILDIWRHLLQGFPAITYDDVWAHLNTLYEMSNLVWLVIFLTRHRPC